MPLYVVFQPILDIITSIRIDNQVVDDHHANSLNDSHKYIAPFFNIAKRYSRIGSTLSCDKAGGHAMISLVVVCLTRQTKRVPYGINTIQKRTGHCLSNPKITQILDG